MIPEENSPAAGSPDSSPRRPRSRPPRRGPRRFQRPPPPKRESTDAAPGPRDEFSRQPEVKPETDRQPRDSGNENAPASPAGPPASKDAIRKAVAQVDHIITELKSALGELEEVLDILEQAEIYQNVTDRELESLRQSLRRLHRGGREPQTRPQAQGRAPTDSAEPSEPAEPA